MVRTIPSPLGTNLGVGDSPEGPLKTGEHRLKPAKSKTKQTSNLSMHTRRGPRCGGPRGPPERPNQAPPSSGFRLARGSTPPSSGFHLARGPTPPSSGFRLARGPTPPSSGFRLAQGPTPPRAGSASLEAPSRAHLLPHAGMSI
jgi:hypothetical protein